MSARPKRVISKPSRYVTTSSDEVPPKQRRDEGSSETRRVSTIPRAGEIQEDIQNIRRALLEVEQDHTILFNNNNNYSMQYPSSNTYVQPQTKIQSHVAAQSDTNFQSPGQRDTIVDIDDQAQTFPETYINLEPFSLSQRNINVSQAAQSLTQSYDTLHVGKERYADNAFQNNAFHSENSGAHRDVPPQNWNVGGSTTHQRDHQLNSSTQQEKSDIR